MFASILSVNSPIIGQNPCENVDLDENCFTYDINTYKCVGSEVGIETFEEAISLGQLLNPSPAQTTAQRVIVLGTFEFQTSGIAGYMFYNSDIVISPGSSFIVNGGRHLNFQTSTLKGCEALWAGIEVLQNGRLTLNTCTISDAEKAVLAAPTTFINIQGTTFLNNNICIAVDDPGNSQAINIQHTIANNTFTSNATLLSTVTNYNEYAYAGVVVHNMALLDFDNKVNTFSNLQSGIVAYNTKVLINSATTFSNINNQPNLNVPGGDGIYINHEPGKPQASITLDGNTDEQGAATFYDCSRAIRVFRSNSTVKNCKLVDCNQGIYVQDLWPIRRVIITDNYFENVKAGVEVYSGENFGIARVTNNKFQLDEPNMGGGYCISFAGGNKPFNPVIDPSNPEAYPELSIFSDGRIESNTIFLDVPLYSGIILNAVSGLYVKNNLFGMKYTEDDPAFKFIDVRTYSAGNKIADNELIRIVPGPNGIIDNDLQYGIHVTDSPWNDYYCNTIGLIENGMQFYGSCHSSVIEGNKMNGCLEGILTGQQLYPGSAYVILGKQPNRGNTWDSNVISDAHWQYLGSSGLEFQLASQFSIHTDDSNGNSAYWPDVVLVESAQPGSQNWIILDEELEEPAVCTNNQEGPGPLGDTNEPVGNGGMLHELDNALMEEDTILNSFPDGILFNLHWALAEKFMRFPHLDTMHSQASSYISDWENSVSGDLYEVNYMIASYNMDTLDIRHIESLEVDRKDLIDSLLILNNMTVDSLQIVAVQSIMNEVENINDTIAEVILELHSDYIDYLLEVDTILSNISPVSLPEIVMSKYLEVLLDELIQPEVNFEANVDTLRVLISNCPDDAGIGMVMALGLVTSMVPDSIFEIGDCSPIIPRQFINPGNGLTIANQLVIFPNPGSDYMQIQGQTGEELMIVDMYGRKIHEQKLNADQIVVNTLTWNSGFYLVRLGNSDQARTQIWIKN